MGTLFDWWRASAEWAGKLASLLLIPLVFITCFEVFMRYVVAMPTIWAWDLNIQIFAAIVMLGGAEALRKGAHIVVDVVVDKAKPRTRAILGLDRRARSLFRNAGAAGRRGGTVSPCRGGCGKPCRRSGRLLLHNEVDMVPLGAFLDVARCGGVLEKLEVIRGRRKES